MSNRILVTISGGSASGKSTLARTIADQRDDVTYIKMDDFYEPQDHLTRQQLTEKNLDTPDNYDWSTLHFVVMELLFNKRVEGPKYHMEDGSVSTQWFEPNDVIIVEGLHAQRLTKVFNESALMRSLSVYVETPVDVRISRRVKRDIRERNMTVDQVLTDIQQNVLPVHRELISEYGEVADLVVDGRDVFIEVPTINDSIDKLL